MVFAAQSVFASGRDDPILRRADELVRQQRYKEAIKVLSEFIKADDKRFDAAQTRIRRILRDFDYYNKLVDKLITTMETTPDDYDTIVSLATEISELDIPHEEEVSRFVARIQETARFGADRREIDKIFREARVMLNNGDTTGALRRYLSGFDVYRGGITRAGFSPELVQESVVTLSRVSAIVGQINNMQAVINESLGVPDARERLDALLPVLDNMIQTKYSLVQAERYFQEVSQRPEIASGNQAGHLFYPLAAMLIRGRSAETIREGMLGVLDEIWSDAVLPLSALYHSVLESVYSEALNAVGRGDYASAEAHARTAKEFLRPEFIAAARSVDFLDPDAPYPKYSLHNKDITGFIEESDIRYRSMDEALNYFISGGDIWRRFTTVREKYENAEFSSSWDSSGVDAERVLEGLRESKVVFRTLNNEINSALSSIETGRNNFDASAPMVIGGFEYETDDNYEAGRRYYDDSRTTIEGIRAVLGIEEISTSGQMYVFANQTIKSRLDSLQKRYEESRRLLDGVEIKTEQGLDVVAKYSREAGDILNGMAGDLKTGITIGDGVILEYVNEVRGGEANEEMTRLVDETQMMTQRLRELEVAEKRDLSVAIDRVGRAESLRVDGERLIADARRALSASDFDRAHERLTSAADRWTQSLDMQENSNLRRAWDTQINPLAEEIGRLEYEDIVREVRGLINSSRERYFAGGFEKAEEALMRAENRWSRVSGTPNDEVIYWLGLVRGALSLRSGTSVPITAPLYPEISQLLSDAKRNYNDGVSLVKVSRREESMMKFARARENAREVRLMFPVNQEAGILELRIDRELDPEAFDAAFRQRFEAAVDGAKNGSRESYFELENLAGIYPDFSGIQAALVEAKYDIGLLVRPADTRQIDRARELSSRALAILNGRRPNYAEASRLAGEALRLNPNDSSAASLLDRIRLSSAREAENRASAVVADQAAEQEYLLAVREFQQGRSLTAYTIIRRLLQRPANQNNTRFNELLRRISATM